MGFSPEIMIHYLKHNEIDKKKWDDSIDQCVNNLIYAHSWYLDIVCPNWNALIENDYESMMPLTGNKKYGIEYLYPPYFAQQLGVFSKEKLLQEKINAFLNSIPVRYKFVELNLNTHNTFEYSGFQIKKNINLELQLHVSYGALRKNYSRLIVRNIKKAIKNEITIQKNIEPSDLINMFRKTRGQGISNLKEKNYKMLLDLIHTCIKRGYCESAGAFTKTGRLCAGIILLIKNNRAIFLFSSTHKLGKENGAMFFLIDNFIRDNAGSEMIFDFEGSNIPGVARLYKGFGSKECVYLQVRKNNLPKLFRWIKG